MHRWTLLWFGERWGRRLPKLLLHHFLPDREDMDLHDHPRGFVTVCLRGGYLDLVLCPTCDGDRHSWWETPAPCGRCKGLGYVIGDSLRRGSIRRRRADYAHMTSTMGSGAWTLCLMFPVRRRWGFWREGRWWPFREYEKRFGMGMRCGDEDPVRYGWDGTGAGNGA